MEQIKVPEDSKVIMTNIVLPGETNYSNNMFGGELLARMDRACSIAARRHAASPYVVTVAVNHVSFERPIPVGSVVRIEAKLTRAFTSSMEIIAETWLEQPSTGESIKTNEGIYTFVAVDAQHKPIKIPSLQPETDLEKERHNAALRRKQLSLVLSNRMKPQEATELKALFT